MYDESEGIAAWYIGYDGTGCVNLLRDGDDVVVSIAHPDGRERACRAFRCPSGLTADRPVRYCIGTLP